jgi:histidinol phosphatase-like PHP family hydrolase
MPPRRPTTISNGDIAELLWSAAEAEAGHRRQALQRAARAARFWPEEASGVVSAERSVTELHGVGPWVGAMIHGWLDDPPAIPEPPETRRGFLTMSEVRTALAEAPQWEEIPHGDLQMHTTDSDGSVPLRGMVSAARELGRTLVAVTDHSQSLKIAHGMDAERLALQGLAIERLNEELAGQGDPFRVLRSMEMDVFADGSSDMESEDLKDLDLVLGAFHSRLRLTDDQTDRYVLALQNPDVQILAHPRARMFGRRVGLRADWSRVFDEAARTGKALEIDATPARQDLDVDLARSAVRAGVQWFSIGSDAHAVTELQALPFGMAIAVLAGVPRERVLNYRPAGFISAWAARLRDGGG